MNRTDRLSAILIQLQSKRIVRAHEIADRFEISLRTVYRDIRALEEAGIPIGAEAGIGYYLMDNYHLPPVMFTNDEASALIFGEKLIEKMSDEKIKKDFCSALFKIKAILKPSEKDYLEKLHEKIAVFNLSAMSERFNQLYLNEIQQALVNKKVLEITYETRYAEEACCRKIEPIGLCNYSSRWHLFAWCQLRNDYRDFRLDRIIALRSTDEFFKGKQHPTIKEYMQMANPISNTPNITIRVPKKKAKLLEDSKYWYGYLSDEEAGDFVRMKFSNDELNGFAIWLLNTGCHAQIEEPIELQQIIQSYIREMVDNYRQFL
jgi:predicted DNA-binding transcriptional regulator YafY